jgi:hypothetical protein
MAVRRIQMNRNVFLVVVIISTISGREAVRDASEL